MTRTPLRSKNPIIISTWKHGLEATKTSMKRAIKKLKIPSAQLIIDGNIDLGLDKYPSKGIIKGDQQSLSIAAASIIAKIHRDRYMKFLSYY